MTSFRDKVNSHLPVVLQVLSTASLVVLALCAVCGSKSLKKIAEGHQIESSAYSYEEKHLKGNHNH